MPKIFLISIEATNKWAREHGKEEFCMTRLSRPLTRKQIREILAIDEQLRDRMSGEYTPREFVETFNDALEIDEITSDRYYIVLKNN